MNKKPGEENMKPKRHVVGFRAANRRGPRDTTRRQEALHAVLPRVGWSTVSEIFDHNPSVAALYKIRGALRCPQSYQDAKRDLVHLVAIRLAEWQPAQDSPAPDQHIRVPTEYETRAGRAAGEEAWVRDGVMLETPANRRLPFRVDNVAFLKTEVRPDGRANIAKLWACLPATHAARLEDLELDAAARQVFMTPPDVFQGLIELVKRGCVEILPLGLANAS